MSIIARIVLGLAAGLLNLSTWLTAIAGSALLLLACYLATGRTRHPMAHR